MKRINSYEYWESMQDPNNVYSSYQQHKNDMYLLLQEDFIQMNLDRIATATLQKELEDLFPQK